MEDLVIMKNKQAVTTSLQVAESFEKNHADVMRSIKNLTQQNCRVKSMFAESTYVNSRNQEQPMHYMNRDGFTLLAMGFTGKKAVAVNRNHDSSCSDFCGCNSLFMYFG